MYKRLQLLVAFLLSTFWVGVSFAANCEGPYRKLVADSRCVWSCAEGTVPDRASNSCVCKPGLEQKGFDQYGRRVCVAAGSVSDAVRKLQQNIPLPLMPRPLREAQTPEQPQLLSPLYPFNTQPYRNCGVFERSGNTAATQVKCSTVRSRPLTFDLLERPELVVRKSQPLNADVIKPGRYRLLFPKPANPPRNSQCDEGVTGVRGSCSSTCLSLDYLTFFDSGRLRAMARSTGAQSEVCGRDYTGQFEFSRPTFALAYDACQQSAHNRSGGDWNFSTSIRVPVRFAGHYGFRDAITRLTSSGWDYEAKVQHIFVEDVIDIPVMVRCR